jgi:hypothetical protein
MMIMTFIPFLLGALSHCTCLFAEFTYDDNPAVLEHPVSRLAQPLRRALFTDYWGLDITSFHSHGSFRPVTTASFALSSLLSRSFVANNKASQKQQTTSTSSIEHTGMAFEYRFISLLLHASSSSLSFLFYFRFSGSTLASLIGASFFAVHPILTEAVCSIACRADLLAGFFSLLVVYCLDAFLYTEEETLKRVCCASFALRSTLLLFSLVFGILATFSKETGVMSLLVATGLCLAVGISHFIWDGKKRSEWTGSRFDIVVRACFGMFFAFLTAVLLFILRLSIQGDRLPQFYVVDNTLVGLTGLPRLLTIIYLAARHLCLLFVPYPQSHDWSFLVIDPVLEIGDIRNALSIIVLGLFTLFTTSSLFSFFQNVVENDVLRLQCVQCLQRRRIQTSVSSSFSFSRPPPPSSSSPTSSLSSSSSSLSSSSRATHSYISTQLPLPISMSICFSIGALFVSFLPASSILFITGFTIAERVLYVPAVFLGLAISLALSSSQLLSLRPRLTLTFATTVCALFLYLSLIRSMVWTNDETLWASALIAAPNHPKALYTLANRLQTKAGTGGKDGYLSVISKMLGPKESERLLKGFNSSAYSSIKEVDLQAALVLYGRCIATFRDRTGRSSLGLDRVSTHPQLSAWDRIFPDPNVNTVNILMDLLDQPKSREELASRQNASANVLRQMLNDLQSDDDDDHNGVDYILQEDKVLDNGSTGTTSAVTIGQLRALYTNTPPHLRMSTLLSKLQSTCSKAPFGSEKSLHLHTNASTSCALSRSGMTIDKGFARVHERVLTVGLSALNAAVFTGEVHGWKLGLEQGGKLFYVDNTIAELLLRSSSILSRSNPFLGPTVAMLTLADSYKMRGAFGLSILWFDRCARWTSIQAEERAKENIALHREKYDTIKVIKSSSKMSKEKSDVDDDSIIRKDYRLSKSFQRLMKVSDELSMNWEWKWPEVEDNYLDRVKMVNKSSLLNTLAMIDHRSDHSLQSNITKVLDSIQIEQLGSSFVKIRTSKRPHEEVEEVNLGTGGSFCTLTSTLPYIYNETTKTKTTTRSSSTFSMITKDDEFFGFLANKAVYPTKDKSFTCSTPSSVGEPCGRILAAVSRAAMAAVTAIEQAVNRGSLQRNKFCTCRNATPSNKRMVNICVDAESALPWSQRSLGFPPALRSHRHVQHLQRHSCPDPCVHWFNENSIDDWKRGGRDYYNKEEEDVDNGDDVVDDGDPLLGLGSFAPIETDAVTFPLALRLARRAVILSKSWVTTNGEEFEEPYKQLFSLCGCE